MDFSEEMTDEILKIFQVESEEIIAKLNSSLLDLEKKPNNKDAILSLFRDAHTLKGASRMVGFGNVQTIAHKIEDILGLAKDNEILLNKKVIDILYKTVDFLYDFIQKSIENKKEVYNDEIANQLSQLEGLKDFADDVNSKQEVIDFDIDLLTQNIKEINELLPNALFSLMRIEIEKNGEFIKEFLSINRELYNIFQKIGYYDLKKWFEDIIVKLEFISKASNNLTDDEIDEIHQTLDNIINKLISTCELYSLESVDYYAMAFTKMAGTAITYGERTQNEGHLDTSPFYIEPGKPAIESEAAIIEEPESKDAELVEEPKTQEAEPVEEQMAEPVENAALQPDVKICKLLDLELLKNKIDVLAQNAGSAVEIKTILVDFEENCTNDNAKKVFERIIKILEFVDENGVQIDEDIASIVKQSLEYCDNAMKDEGQYADNELVLQRLQIVRQVLELKQEKNDEFGFVSKGEYRVKNRKIADFSKIFNTGSIKTLRVESSKLDTLVNQVSELTITKIKSKKHMQELNTINKDLEEWQRNSVKVLNYLKYYDKKYFQTSSNANSFSFFVKQLLTLFNDNNKKIQETVGNISGLHRTIQEDDMKMSLIIDNLESMVKNIRILPLATVFHLFGRMVRDIAQEKNKQIELEIVGSETSTDKKIIEEIKTPLIHIIRNSIDHGIETPEERIAMGKNPVGKIILSARAADNKVIIEIKDDGKGINLEKVKEKAIQKGYLNKEDVDSMTDEQITNILFVPGFSTGEEITNISGRGIGLDVVQTKISQLNGKVKIFSEVNKGCCVQIELPTSMSTLKVFLVKSAEQTFAIPMEVINVVLRKKSDDIITNKGKKSIVFNEKTIPLYDLSDILNLQKTEIETTSKTKETILIIESDGKIMALCVDKLIGDQEILHKKLSAPFYRLKNISGITTLVSGEICLILSISDIMNTTFSSKAIKTSVQSKDKCENDSYKILIVDDSITTRTLEKNILTRAGYGVESAENPIEAMELIKSTKFDLIISDIEMPEMDGLEFLEKLKTDEMYNEIPVIMVSSLMSEENKKRSMKLGAKKYILKHEFNQDLFLETVSKILREAVKCE